MTTIAWRVAELAAQRGWSTRRLAQAARLDEKTVRNILAGRATRVDLDTIAQLSEALGVRPGSLWRVEPDASDAWNATAGSAGHGQPSEILRVLTGEEPDEHLHPALERALRSP